MCEPLLRLAASIISIVAIVSIDAAAQRPPRAVQPKPQKWTAPRTPDGQPDLQGVWSNNSATPLERPKDLEGRQFLTDEEVAQLKERAARLFGRGNSDFASGDNLFLAALANLETYKNPDATGSSYNMVEREFDNRTSLITSPPDGRIPPRTLEGQQRQAAAERIAGRPAAGPEDVSNPVRCITYGVPRLGEGAAKLGSTYGTGPYSYFQIVQAPGYVVLVTEAIHDARIIPLDGRSHLGSKLHQWNGDSRGRWEGDSLVVDTTNFSPTSNFWGSAEHLHLIERFSRTGPDTITYLLTIDDPTTWISPWTAEVRLQRAHDEIYEFACHEGNQDVMRGILAGARAQEKKR